MKKKGIIIGCTLAGILFLSAGCGSKKTLECKQSSDGVNIELSIGFRKDNVEAMNLKYDMDLSAFSDSQIAAIKKQDFCSTIKESMSGYTEAFKNCSQDVQSKKLVVNSELDVEKISKEEKEHMNSFDSAKKSLEDEGYSCTVK